MANFHDKCHGAETPHITREAVRYGLDDFGGCPAHGRERVVMMYPLPWRKYEVSELHLRVSETGYQLDIVWLNISAAKMLRVQIVGEHIEHVFCIQSGCVVQLDSTVLFIV